MGQSMPTRRSSDLWAYIRTPGGGFIYGYAVANDTGTGLVEGIIDVDLFYDTYEQSVLNSVRWVDIYILE